MAPKETGSVVIVRAAWSVLPEQTRNLKVSQHSWQHKHYLYYQEVRRGVYQTGW